MGLRYRIIFGEKKMVKPPVADNICIKCKGARLLCGKDKCPILQKSSILKSTIPNELKNLKKDKIIFGASPPAVFVGHVGYPKVNIGPLLPLGKFAEQKDTKYLDTPENWYGKSIDEIIAYRSGMIRSNFSLNVKYNESIEELLDKSKPNSAKLLEATQELTMASNSVDTEAELKRIHVGMKYDNHSQPQGPSGRAEKIRVVDNVKVLKPVDKVVYDTDLTAADAITGYLYKDGGEVPLSMMQRLFSAGMLGVKKKRKLVPTRWTITAVDDIIGKELAKNLHHKQDIDKYYTFYGEYLDNKFLILLMPGPWSFEMNECWNPESIWNRLIPGINIAELHPTIMTDYEYEHGRKKYADNVTGAYYAARKEVEEFLVKRNRQARAIVFREVAGGYTVPLGVWVIRETVRHILQNGWLEGTVQIHETLNDSLARLSDVFMVKKKFWIKSSKLVPYVRTQTSMNVFL